MSAAGSLLYCSSMAGISDAINSAQQHGQANTTNIGGVDWDTIQSYNVPYLLFYYLYNPRAGFPLIQVPLLGHLLLLISIALISKRLQCRLPLPPCFSLPRFEFGAFVPSEPHLHFVLGQDDGPCLVPEEESQDDVESMDNNEEEVVFEERDIANHKDVEINELKGEGFGHPGRHMSAEV